MFFFFAMMRGYFCITLPWTSVRSEKRKVVVVLVVFQGLLAFIRMK